MAVVMGNNRFEASKGVMKLQPPENKRRRVICDDVKAAPTANVLMPSSSGAPHTIQLRGKGAETATTRRGWLNNASGCRSDSTRGTKGVDSRATDGPTAVPVQTMSSRVSCGEYDDLFLSDFDWSATASERLVIDCQPVFLAWREAEQRISSVYWMLSFTETKAEEMRLICMQSIFKYVSKRSLGLTTLHLTSHYVNRLFYYYIIEQQGLKLENLLQHLVTAVGASMRTAVKMQERLHHVDPFRSKPGHLWEDLELAHLHNNGNRGSNGKKDIELLNQMERVHMQILEHETMLHVPVAPDFFDQYLKIGGWPDTSAGNYRDLGQFLLARSLFATGVDNALRGTAPSKLAAGALVLAVKIINGNNSYEPFEFWTKKLENFTQFSMKDIQPVVQSLSRMLRRKEPPTISDILRRMFPAWGGYAWC